MSRVVVVVDGPSVGVDAPGAIITLGWWCARTWQRHRAGTAELARRNAEIAARADEEHRLWMHGDERGFYGQYPPPPTA